MTPVLRVSDVASLAMHAAVLLARGGEGARSVPRMADELGVSADHLAKVLQRLAKAGLVRAGRGRAGGYALARPAAEIRMLEVIEGLEGPLGDDHSCVFGKPLCDGACQFRDLVDGVTRQVRDRLAATTLADAVAGMRA